MINALLRRGEFHPFASHLCIANPSWTWVQPGTFENPRIPKQMEAEQNQGLEDQIDAGEITPLISGWNKKFSGRSFILGYI